MEDIFLPVVESSMVLASHYTKACGRSSVTAQDVDIGLKYAIRNVLGKQTGSLFPEIYDSEESDDEDDIEVVDDSEEAFTRYQGTEELYVKMNECLDTWDEWEPETPAEIILKNGIQKIKHLL